MAKPKPKLTLKRADLLRRSRRDNRALALLRKLRPVPKR